MVWQRYLAIERSNQDGANIVMQTCGDANAFPSSFREPLRDNIRNYALGVTDYGLKTLHSSHCSDHVDLTRIRYGKAIAYSFWRGKR
jgi:hypothetical protein